MTRANCASPNDTDPVPRIDAFVREQLALLDTMQPGVERHPSALPGLNTLFHRTFDENGD